MVKEYKVYRVDYLNKMKIPIGTVTERRSRPRSTVGLIDLLKLARKLYAQSAEDCIRIVVGEEHTA